MQTLQAELDTFRAERERRAPVERRLAFERHIEALRANGAEARATKPCDEVPGWRCPTRAAAWRTCATC